MGEVVEFAEAVVVFVGVGVALAFVGVEVG